MRRLIVHERSHRTAASTDQQFEYDSWLKDCEFRERDFEQRAREVSAQEGELEVKRREQRRGLVTNPLALALVAATIAALANVFVAFHNADEQRVLGVAPQPEFANPAIITTTSGDMLKEDPVIARLCAAAEIKA